MAEVGAPTSRPPVGTPGVAAASVSWAIEFTGTLAAITAPTVPASPSMAFRRVMGLF
jgi:hypothetical protein